MKKSVKITCLVAVFCIILGLLIVLGTSLKIGFDYNQLNTDTLETKSYTVEQPFQNIDIQSQWSNVYFAVAQDAQCEVVYTETERKTCAVSVENDTLTVSQKDTRRWYECFGILWSSDDVNEMKITVYLPEQSYHSLHIQSQSGNIALNSVQVQGSVDLKTNSGNLQLEDLTAQDLTVETTSGNITLKAIKAQDRLDVKSNSGTLRLEDVITKELVCATTSGDITLNTVKAQGRLDLKSNSGTLRLENVIAQELICATTSGDIWFKDSDAGMLEIYSNSGCVKGNLLSEKKFEVSTNSGSVDVPYSNADAGLCAITTTNGDIALRISEK